MTARNWMTAVFSAAAVATLATNGPAVATAPPTSVPAGSVPPDDSGPSTIASPSAPSTPHVPVPSIPEGFVPLVDDTGLLTMAVPETWTDVDPVPAEDVDGQPQPWLAASTDIETFLRSFDASGALFVAFAYDPDPQNLIDQFSLLDGCAEFAVDAYDDGRFNGLVQLGTGCGNDGDASWTLVVANPANPAGPAAEPVDLTAEATGPAIDPDGPPQDPIGAPVTVLVQLQSADAGDEADVEAVLASIALNLRPDEPLGAPGDSSAPTT